MANNFKEYQAYLPPKWTGFDKLPQGGKSMKKNLSFANQMYGRSASAGPGQTGGAGDDELLVNSSSSEDDDEGTHYGGVGRRSGGGNKTTTTAVPGFKKARQYVVNGVKLRGSEAWAHEMSLYRKEEEQKQIAKLRTEELEIDLKRRQKQSLARKKKALEAPTLNNGSRMPARYHTMSMSHPDEVARYRHLLSTATVVDQQKRRDKCEDYAMLKQSKIDEKVVAHQSQIDERLKEHSLDVKYAVKRLRHKIEDEQIAAQERREEKMEADLTEAKNRHLATLKKEKELKDRQEAAESLARERRSEQSMLKAKRVESAIQKKQEVESGVEDRMKMQSERAMQQLADMESRRRAVVDTDPVGKALARAAQVQAEEKQKKQQQCEQDRLKREERLKNKKLDDKYAHDRLVRTLKEREEVVEENLAEKFTARKAQIRSEIKYHHQPAYEYPTPVPVVEEKLRYSYQLQADLAQKEAERQNAVEAHRLERDTRVTNINSVARARQHEAYVKDEDKRNATRQRAAEIEGDFQSGTEQRAIKSRMHSEDVLFRLHRERSRVVEKESSAKTERILNALDLVNVQKVKAAVKSLRAKEAKVAECKKQLAEEQRRSMEEKRRQDEADKDRMNRQIQQAQESRENHTQQKLDEFDERRRKAQSARDDAQRNQSDKLRDQYEHRMSKVRATEEKKEAQFVKRMGDQLEMEKEYNARRKEDLRDLALIRKDKAEQLAEKTEECYANRTEHRDKWMDSTMEHLDKTYAKGAMSPAHPLTESFGSKWTKPSMQPPRARTMSPAF